MNYSAFQTYFHKLILPGIVLHELSHALMVTLIPGNKITELNLTSNVKYNSQNATATRTFIIAYAPVLLNTALAFGCIQAINQIDPVDSLANVVLFISLFYIAFVSAFASLPSYEDAIAPIKTLYYQIYSIRFILVLLIGPIYFIISIPILIFSYIQRISYTVQLITNLAYVLIIFGLGFGLIELPIDLAQEAISNLYRSLY